MRQFRGVTTRSLLSFVVICVALGATACTKGDSAEASAWDMPEVVWDGGASPSGGVEDSQWAQDFREAHLMRAYVAARQDASYGEYVKKFGYEAAVEDAEFLVRGYNALGDFDTDTGEYVSDAPVRWDAQRMLIRAVTDEPGGDSAVINYCYVIYASGSFREQVQCGDSRIARNADGTVALEGVLSSDAPVSGVDGGAAQDPDVDQIPTARWATPIVAPTLPGEVKMPLPRDYYVKLGVLDD